MAWRRKWMRLEEWAPLQERFGEYQLLQKGDPDLAMFLQSVPGEEASIIYIHGPGIELVERFSPGGWEDSDPPSGKGLSLLVGTADSFDRFGIERPA